MTRDRDENHDRDDEFDQQSPVAGLLAAGVFVGALAVRAIRKRRHRHHCQPKHNFDDETSSIHMSDVTISGASTPLLKSPRRDEERTLPTSPFTNTSLCSDEEEEDKTAKDRIEDEHYKHNIERIASRIYKRIRVFSNVQFNLNTKRVVEMTDSVDQLAHFPVHADHSQVTVHDLQGLSLLEKGFGQRRKSDGLIEVCMT